MKQFTTFVVNMSRLNLSEWQRLGIRSSVPDIDRRIAEIQKELGCDRAQAAYTLSERMMEEAVPDSTPDE